MGYDEGLRELPRSWDALVRRGWLCAAEVDRLERWAAALRDPARRGAVRDAVVEVRGVEFATFLGLFLGLGRNMEQVERRLKWPSRSGKLALRLLLADRALDALVTS
jgi:hypothetical protein